MSSSLNSNHKTKIIYCSDCSEEILIEYLDDDSIIVHCPQCIGECITCNCHLATKCFADIKNVKIIHPEPKS